MRSGRPRKVARPLKRKMPPEGGRPPTRLEIVFDVSREYTRLRISNPELSPNDAYRLLARQLGYPEQQLPNGAEYLRQQLRHHDKHSATGGLDQLIAKALGQEPRK